MGVCFSNEQELRKPKFAKLIQNSEISRAAKLESIRTYYEFIRVIGHGQFGTVREAVKLQPSRQSTSRSSAVKGKRYAIKSITKNRVKKNINMMKRELEILQQVDHPNIIKLYEIYEDQKYIHMVTELCTGGDLFDYLISKGSITEQEVARIMYSLFAAVNHLHSIKICHRDLKPENFLFSSKEHDSVIKLVDFGMSAKFGQEGMYTMVGTPYYLAPEILKGVYDKDCDVWSLGVVMYFLLSGKQPFKGFEINDLFRKIVRADYNFYSPIWKTITLDAKDLISKMLVPHNDSRISLTKAFSHPWFQNQASKCKQIPPKIFESLRKYKAPGKLWQEAMKVLVRNLSKDQMNELQEAFEQFDQSKTGFISASDIEAAMKRNGYYLAKSEIKELINNVDYLGNGKLNYTQFLIAAIDRKQVIDDEVMWEVFKHFDYKAQGYIHVSDLKYALEKAGCYTSEEEMQEILQEFELKAGELMVFEEFRDVMMCFSEENSLEEEAPKRNPKRRLSQRKLTIRRNSITNTCNVRRSFKAPTIT